MLYSKIGFELRDWLAPRHLTIAAYTHGLVGYATTAKAKQQGGYGAAIGRPSRIAISANHSCRSARAQMNCSSALVVN